MEIAYVNELGSVTIPESVRQQLGIHQGSSVEFKLVGNHAELHVRTPAESGFGMIKSTRPAVAADFDPAALLKR